MCVCMHDHLFTLQVKTNQEGESAKKNTCPSVSKTRVAKKTML
jgi:hypothetical protein